MSPLFLILLAIPVIFIALAVWSRSLTGGAQTTVRWLTTLASLPLLAFCAFGFLATYEGGPGAISFRVGYAVLFVSVSIAVLLTWFSPGRLVGGPREQRK